MESSSTTGLFLPSDRPSRLLRSTSSTTSSPRNSPSDLPTTSSRVPGWLRRGVGNASSRALQRLCPPSHLAPSTSRVPASTRSLASSSPTGRLLLVVILLGGRNRLRPRISRHLRPHRTPRLRLLRLPRRARRRRHDRLLLRRRRARLVAALVRRVAREAARPRGLLALGQPERVAGRADAYAARARRVFDVVGPVVDVGAPAAGRAGDAVADVAAGLRYPVADGLDGAADGGAGSGDGGVDGVPEGVEEAHGCGWCWLVWLVWGGGDDEGVWDVVLKL